MTIRSVALNGETFHSGTSTGIIRFGSFDASGWAYPFYLQPCTAVLRELEFPFINLESVDRIRITVTLDVTVSGNLATIAGTSEFGIGPYPPAPVTQTTTTTATQTVQSPPDECSLSSIVTDLISMVTSPSLVSMVTSPVGVVVIVRVVVLLVAVFIPVRGKMRRKK